VSIKAYDDKQAHTLLKQQKLQGYFVFDKGMTKAFSYALMLTFLPRLLPLPIEFKINFVSLD
jgi:hypothetical protein